MRWQPHGPGTPEEEIPLAELPTLRPDDILAAVKYLVELKNGADPDKRIDDIDHLGNRRVRVVGELLENQYRIGLVRMERAIKERMSLQEIETLMPHDLINSKPVTAVVKEFFGSSQLSQFMDQTNPLSAITHKRRLSALGPGGLTRERAGFEVRDVHPTHYGRICPIETPEGPNIGLIASLSTYARVNDLGFIETPYRAVSGGRVSAEVKYLTALDEERLSIAQANAQMDEQGRYVSDVVQSRKAGEFVQVPPETVDMMDVSPSQLVSVAAALIPFLENDDANRALMGSNMQRQAVPLLRTEAPLVGTGMEAVVARDSGVTVVAKRDGVVESVDASRIVVKPDDDEHGLERRHHQPDQVPALEPEHLHQPEADREAGLARPARAGDRGRPRHRARRARARPERARRVHALGRVQLRRLDPDLGARGQGRLLHLDPHRGVRVRRARHQARQGGHHPRHPERRRGGAQGPRRVGHRADRRRGEAGRRAGRQDHAEGRDPALARGAAAARDLRREGRRRARHVAARAAGSRGHGDRRAGVLAARRREGRARARDRRGRDRPAAQGPGRRDPDHPRERAEQGARGAHGQARGEPRRATTAGSWSGSSRAPRSRPRCSSQVPQSRWKDIQLEDARAQEQIDRIFASIEDQANVIKAVFDEKIARLRKGDELPPGVFKMVKVYLAIKRKLSVGDKMAGRHGNKGVISRILPEEDMPYMADGSPVDIVLNPLGVPSRMNIGQILETHLGWAARGLGEQIDAMLHGDGRGRIPQWCARR